MRELLKRYAAYADELPTNKIRFGPWVALTMMFWARCKPEISMNTILLVKFKVDVSLVRTSSGLKSVCLGTMMNFHIVVIIAKKRIRYPLRVSMYSQPLVSKTWLRTRSFVQSQAIVSGIESFTQSFVVSIFALGVLSTSILITSSLETFCYLLLLRKYI